MIQDFYIFLFFFFANITASCQQKKPKRQPKRTNSRWEWNTRLFQSSTLIRFSGVFRTQMILKANQQGISQNKTRSEHKRNIFFKKEMLRLYENNRRGENFSTRYANTVRQTLVRGMLKGQGRAGFLFLGAPRLDGAFPFFHAHWGGRFMGLNKVLMEVRAVGWLGL